MRKLVLLIALGTFLGTSAWAAPQSVTLSVSGMTCAACPITVKKALTKVDGVINVEASFEEREVTVIFDDTKTDVQLLTKATESAGYSASVKE